jgi:hypothetical protein
LAFFAATLNTRVGKQWHITISLSITSIIPSTLLHKVGGPDRNTAGESVGIAVAKSWIEPGLSSTTHREMDALNRQHTSDRFA